MQNPPVLNVPVHLGFILDGNRRWAKKHGLPTYEGHLAGYTALKDVVLYAVDRGVKYVSLYAFSTENWKRPEGEVSYLMKLMLRAMKSDLKELINSGVRVRVLGDRKGLDEKLVTAIQQVEESTKHLTRGTVAVCFNYGGQAEIVEAARRLVADGLKPDEITEDTLRARLYEPEIPDIDMVVRTSGEQRLSNFMLWRVAYSELMFIDKFWPDMKHADIDVVLEEFANRHRRFGN